MVIDILSWQWGKNVWPLFICFWTHFVSFIVVWFWQTRSEKWVALHFLRKIKDLIVSGEFQTNRRGIFQGCWHSCQRMFQNLSWIWLLAWRCTGSFSKYCVRRLIRSWIIESATYCNQMLLFPLFLNSKQKMSDNWINWLLWSLLCWPKVILLCGGRYNTHQHMFLVEIGALSIILRKAVFIMLTKSPICNQKSVYCGP